MSTAFGPDSAHLAALHSVVSRLEAVEIRIREAEAERLSLLAEALDIAASENERRVAAVPSGSCAELAYRAVRAEVAAVLRQSERAVERRMSHAHALTADYPEVFEAYRSGRISEQHTTVIADAGLLVGSGESPGVLERRSAYETAALEVALTETPARLRPVARRLAEQFAEEPLDERHAEARRRRRVSLIDGEDGMSDLIAHIPTAEAHAVYQRLTAMSVRIERQRSGTAADARIGTTAGAAAGTGASADANAGPGADTGEPEGVGIGALVAPCGRDGIRADLLTDLLLSGAPGSGPGTWPTGLGAIRAQVQVIVTDEALLRGGAALGPASGTIPLLAGHGPIDTGTARRLAAAAAHWDTVDEDPLTGAVLSVDRYRPSESMRRFLVARDEHCRFPGCRVPASRCDVDHTLDAAFGGPTATDNLAHLCRGHHTLKHHTGWRVRQREGGALVWTSPTGRVYRDRPGREAGSRVRFVPSLGSDADPPPF